MEGGGFKTCRFCQEKIRASALKCRFCGEFFDPPIVAAAPIEANCIEIEGTLVDSSETVRPRPKKSESFFHRYWSGEFTLLSSLAVAGAGILLFTVILGLGTPLFLDNTLSGVSFTGIVLYAVSLGALTCFGIAAWRSAARHVDRGGKQRWASAARIAISVVGLAVAWVAAARIFPQTREFLSQLDSNGRIPPFDFQVIPDEGRVNFTGGIRAGASKQLFRLLQENPEIRLIQISSIAGRMDEAIEMAQLVSGFGLTTSVPDQCFGPAALVFLAGKERILSPGGVVGFDSGDFPGITPGRREMYDEMALNIFREAGVKKSFANRALTSAPEQMWFPGTDELRRCGVVTREEASANSMLLSHSLIAPN